MGYIKKNDQVICITGKNRGKKGKVLKVFKEKDQILVEGLNIGKRHTKARPPKVPKGGIIEKAMPLHISNVKLICAACSKPARVNMKTKADGKKDRICKKCGQTA